MFLIYIKRNANFFLYGWLYAKRIINIYVSAVTFKYFVDQCITDIYAKFNERRYKVIK